ncbi:hypothetical protein [Enterobacter roggenkampii]|uniref:hypothetical protein n=1 Tax=Enterobacter roggenkampii TaxID=1812935 RepID=UPI002DB9554D|nr:hypothetical protein [Enterobacter roggenkampii]MEB5890003.1 hypothetical protein [Enterobacter roggenkampii]
METKTSLFPVVRDDIHFDTLSSTAQAFLSASGGQLWSHTAATDPGVTLLEAFTYGVSDLAYRHSLPLNDLLTTDDSTKQSLFPEAFSPENVLTCDPVTADDYRRALLDLHTTDDDPGHFFFRDVQLIQEPAEERYRYYYHRESREFNFRKGEQDEKDAISLTLKGNYWLYLALQDENDRALALERVTTWLEHHRNLGESVSRIIWLSPCAVDLTATIELEDGIDSDDKTAEVLARIYQAASEWCSPSIARYTTPQLIEKGMSPDAVMEGPRLQHGWIPQLPDETDYSIKRSVVLNLLVNPLLAIPGVKRIRHLDCKANIKKESYACLWKGDSVKQAIKHITLISKGGIHKVVTAAQLRDRLSPEPLLQCFPSLLPTGRYRQPGASHPVSELLPPCYGLQGRVEGSEQKQLHQFMLPFEQLLNNGCQQLAKLPQQLSFERERGSQVWGLQWPLLPASPAREVHQGYAAKLAKFLEENRSDVNKELETVNYLLGYFDRTVAVPGLDTPEAYLASQQYYLSHYAGLAAQRSTIRTKEMSSLQKRLTARLGLYVDQHAETAARTDTVPFFLIEHRKLLPEKPDAQFDNEQQPASAEVVAREGSSHLKIVLSGGNVQNVRAGQLVDLLLPAGRGSEKQRLRCLLVMSVSPQENAFFLEIAASPQLKNDIQRVINAASQGTLTWCNSVTWLQDMNYQLTPDSNQEKLSANQKRLLISPYPVMINPGDRLTAQFEVTPEGAVDEDVVRKTLSFNVKEVDPILNTVVMEIENNDAWPEDNALRSYGWYFGDNTYVGSDRFSFVISLVFRRRLVSQTDDPRAFEAWIKNIIREEVPAHISVVIHWMSDSDFSALASNYHAWQTASTEVGIYSFGLLKKLALGHIPSSLNGIGTMFIADDAQWSEAVGPGGNEWHPEVIEQNELFYIPAEIP